MKSKDKYGDEDNTKNRNRRKSKRNGRKNKRKGRKNGKRNGKNNQNEFDPGMKSKDKYDPMTSNSEQKPEMPERREVASPFSDPKNYLREKMLVSRSQSP